MWSCSDSKSQCMVIYVPKVKITIDTTTPQCGPNNLVRNVTCLRHYYIYGDLHLCRVLHLYLYVNIPLFNGDTLRTYSLLKMPCFSKLTLQHLLWLIVDPVIKTRIGFKYCIPHVCRYFSFG